LIQMITGTSYPVNPWAVLHVVAGLQVYLRRRLATPRPLHGNHLAVSQR